MNLLTWVGIITMSIQLATATVGTNPYFIFSVWFPLGAIIFGTYKEMTKTNEDSITAC